MATCLCRVYVVRLDCGFEGGKTCQDFYRASRPTHSKPPVAAYRFAYRSTLDDIIQRRGIKGSVRKVAIRCNDPAPRFKSGLRRIVLTAQLPPMSIHELISVMNALSAHFRDFEQGVLTLVGGPGSAYAPFFYNYKTAGWFAICAEGSVGCNTRPWNPKDVNVLRVVTA